MLLTRAAHHLQPHFLYLLPNAMSGRGGGDRGTSSSSAKKVTSQKSAQKKNDATKGSKSASTAKKSKQSKHQTPNSRKQRKEPTPGSRQSARLREKEDQRERLGQGRSILQSIMETRPMGELSQLTNSQVVESSQDLTVIEGTQTQLEPCPTLPQVNEYGGFSPQQGDGAVERRNTDDNPLGLTPESQASRASSQELLSQQSDGNDEDQPADEGFVVGVDTSFGRYGDEAAAAIYDQTFTARTKWCSKDTMINDANRPSFEINFAIQAGSTVSEDGEKPAKDRMPLLVQTYKNLIEDYDDALFTVGLKKDMSERFKRTRKELDGEQIWKKFYDARKELRRLFSLLPADYGTLPSGTTLWQMIQRRINDLFRATDVSFIIPIVTSVNTLTDMFVIQPSLKDLSEEQLKEELPDEFFLTHQDCRCILAVMVHRRNTELCRDAVSSQTTREDQRKKNRAQLVEARRTDQQRFITQVQKTTGPHHDAKRVKLQMQAVRQGIKGNKVQCEDTRSKIVMRKFKMLQEMKTIIEEKEGIDSYNDKMLKLRDEMFKPAESSSDEEDSNEDNDGNNDNNDSVGNDNDGNLKDDEEYNNGEEDEASI